MKAAKWWVVDLGQRQHVVRFRVIRKDQWQLPVDTGSFALGSFSSERAADYWAAKLNRMEKSELHIGGE